jgi:hypothetical protein
MENISDTSTNQHLIQDRKKYYRFKRVIWRQRDRKKYKRSYQDILQQVTLLPQDIKSKILTYYLSFGSPCAVILRPEIINKCRNNSVTIWFANVDYCIHANKKYMLSKSIGCPFEVLCELRLALLDNHIENGNGNEINFFKSRKINLINNINTLTKNNLLQILEEEAEILIY